MKVSGSQIFWLIASMEIGMTVLLAMTPAIDSAKQDAWISMILAGAAGLAVTFIATKLSLLHPSQTLVEFSQTILGKWLGKIIVIPYFIAWYSVSGTILRQSSDFIHIALFRTTPLWAVVLASLILMTYVNYQGGIEGIGRCSEFLGPLIFLSIIGVMILNWKNMHFVRLLPVYYDSGWFAIAKGALAPASFLGESVMVTMMIAFMSEPRLALSRTMYALVLSSTVVFLATVSVLLTFGPLGYQLWFPFFDMSRFVSVMEFIQNIDAVIVILWLLSVFIKLSLYMFVTSYGLAQWLGVANWRRLLWFSAPVIFGISIIYPNMDVSTVDYPTKFWQPIAFPVVSICIPILLWAIGAMRKRGNRGRGRRN